MGDDGAIAGRFEELARLLEEQGASEARVRFYRDAAARIRDQEAPLLRLVAAIGAKLVVRLEEELGAVSLAALGDAVASGRLGRMRGFGAKRVQAVRELLSAGGGTVVPDVAELLDVDAEYRDGALRGSLPLTAPVRRNPARRLWPPVLHTERGDRRYTAMFSNSPRAHELGKTSDWVVITLDDAPLAPWTIVTAERGALAGHRVVRGREKECAACYKTRRRTAP